MKPAFVVAPSALRGTFALLLAGLIAVAVNALPPAGAQPKKEPEKKEPEKKEQPKQPEIKWPTEINGKDIKAIMKDMEDPDPTVREFAVQVLPNFGPPAQKGAASKLLLKRMTTEPDPSVKMAVYNSVGLVHFEDTADVKTAVRILSEVVDQGQRGGLSRLRAIQALAMLGPKAEGGITALTGTAITDPSYQTRQSIANALGRVGFNEETGPNMKAMRALAGPLAKDSSAAVRTEALQALMLLGPPWAGVMKAGAKQPPPIDTKNAEVITTFMRERIGDPKTKKPTLEKDKQVEIWARLVLMRFDPTEVNDVNLDAFAAYLSGNDIGVKLQALQAIGLLGESAAKKINSVVGVLNDKGLPRAVTVTTINVLMAMGAGAKPAVPDLRKMAAETKAAAAKKKDAEKAADEELVKLIEAAIKQIEEAKPMGSASSDPKKP